MECSIDLVVDLVNSENPVSGRDDLPDVAALRAFLTAHLTSYRGKPTRRDLDEVRLLRGRLREVFEAPDQTRAVEILNTLLAESGARPELTNHDGGPWHLHYTPLSAPISPRLAAEAAMALSVVIAEDGFDRLRVCDGPRCVDVFVDESKNRSRRFCSPQVCGNRASVAAYRARVRASHG
jgi:predicted RNA-binding Zn ribbon-like protein